MNFNYSENQQLISETISDFSKRKIIPNLMQWDNAQYFPIDTFKELGELGMLGVLVPVKYGGSGFGYNEYVTVVSEIGKVCGSIGLSVAAHNSLCVGHILKYGSEAQKLKWLPGLSTGEYIGAWALTETGTGSDALQMNTTATKKGDKWILNGSKNFITHGVSSDVIVVVARTGEKGDSHGISAFIVDKKKSGVKSGKKEDKLGMRASETSEVIFDNCEVDSLDILGEEGEGFIQAMKILDGGRISIAALALGISKGAYSSSVLYSKEREQFGRPISQFQAIAFKLADMKTEIEVSELMIYRACQLIMNNMPVTKESAMAKYYASETCVKIANDAVQIFGGYGYTKDFPVEKYYRDSKLCTIGEGTSEIQKIVISKHII
ncbi:MAG: acyl-CoA dehydrogenase [Flavobacteriales bacterium]|jgi:alkylation response protein AidB-like acyl-CoA dehydrogenase|nr:acyl-CoA dehydrogenase [Flavobacteriales bacterium]|tara:strand:+ start:11085 stop:12221 length:1137 start_codon:yes stop_codon:yes gene_type:complete